VFFQQLYVRRLRWPSLPSAHDSQELFFTELEVLLIDFLDIVFFIKFNLWGSCQEIVFAIEPSAMSIQSMIFLCEFLSCPQWSKAVKVWKSEIATAQLDRIDHRKPNVHLSDESKASIASSICPTSEFPAFIIHHWEFFDNF
jgi:hypothetical protein